MTTTDRSSQLHLRAYTDTPDGAEYLTSLYAWLLEDAGTSEAVSIETISRKNDTEMAGALETVLAIADQSVNLANLVLAYLTWRSTFRLDASRSNATRVTTEVNGVTLHIDGMSDEQLRELINSLNRGEVVGSRGISES